MAGVEITPSRLFVCVAFWQFSHPNWMKTSRKKKTLLTATYFFFPKKHMPMLFHRGGLSGTAHAATLYLFIATSKSPWVCIMLPAARMA